MAQTQFRSDDTQAWTDGYGKGSDGSTSINTSTDATANTTLTGTSGGTSATAGSGTGFAAGSLVLIIQSQGTGAYSWELNKISSVGLGTNWTMGYTLKNTYGTGAQVYLLKQYSTVTINGSNTLTSSSWAGSTGGIVAILANTSITVTGNISANAVGFRGGVMGAQNAKGQYGEGGTGVAATASTNAANGNGGGADATGIELSSGSGGGNGTAGSSSLNTPNGGATAGAADLTTAAFGGGGASGTWNINSVSGNANGGVGGGLILLIAPLITVTGGITSNGGNGTSATDDNGLRGFAGGGSSGGSILLKGSIIILGSSLVTALAGAGGTGTGSSESHPGGSGGLGRIHADYGVSISGTTNPTINPRQDTVLIPSSGIAAFDI